MVVLGDTEGLFILSIGKATLLYAGDPVKGDFAEVLGITCGLCIDTLVLIVICFKIDQLWSAWSVPVNPYPENEDETDCSVCDAYHRSGHHVERTTDGEP